MNANLILFTIIIFINCFILIHLGEVNSAFIADNQSTPSRKSTNIQPVMVAPPVVDSDHYSEYSHHTLRSNKGFRQDTFSNNSAANFQL